MYMYISIYMYVISNLNNQIGKHKSAWLLDGMFSETAW